MTESYYASYSPVFRLAGDLHGEIARDLQSLEIEEGTDGLRRLRLELVAIAPDGDPAYVDGKVLDFGKSLQVAIGPVESQTIVFVGPISAISVRIELPNPPMVVIEAEDRLMQLRMTRRCRTYENVTDADIASRIAGEHGLSADVAGDGPTYDVVQQMNQSDLAFLRERADRSAAEVWLSGSTLHFKSRDRRPGESIELVAGNQLVRLDVRADLAHQRSEVHVGGYDAAARGVIDESAGDAEIRGEVSGGRTGPAVLGATLGASVSNRTRQVPLTSGEAKAWARAELLRRARRFVVARGTTRGSPTMTVGSKLKLDGVGAAFRGEGYYVTWIRHTYDPTEGMRTHFEAERPTVNERAS